MDKLKNGSKKRNLKKLTLKVALVSLSLNVPVWVLLALANGGHTPSSETLLNLGIISLLLTTPLCAYAYKNWSD